MPAKSLSLKMASCYSSLIAMSTCFRWSSAVILCVVLLGRVEAQDRRHEVRALLNFKNQDTEGPISNLFEGYWTTWNESSQNPCSWTGVVCSTNFTVVELDLSGWGMGPVSVQPLAGLPDLRHLDLSSSFLSGSLPDDIGFLTGLVRLDASFNSAPYNQLSSIPASISNCTSLQYLSLEQNNIEGEIPSFRALVNLEILNLADNRLTGPFPQAFLELSSLVRIDLSGNMLDGTIPSLPKLTNLQDLWLDNNNFVKFEESWLPPPGLKSLHVSSNLLDGMVPPSIATLSTLETLDLSRNKLSSIPFSISELSGTPLLPNYLSVDLSLNQLRGNVRHILPVVSNMGLLLNLSYNKLTGSIPLDGDQIQFYSFLDLSYNQLSGPIPSFFANYESSIQVLRLQNNHLAGDIVDTILNPLLNPNTQSIYTVELTLQNNVLTGDLSRVICGNATDPRFSSVITQQAITLDISNNNLQMTTTETNPFPLTTILECFIRVELTELRMAGNNFSGTNLPTHFTVSGLVNQFEILDLSNNHLNGEISGTFFNSTGFPGLQYLNLSNNDIIGPVPEDVVRLPNLGVLDVANNFLSGPLPTILLGSRLFNRSFFVGNAGLCGDPLPPCQQHHSKIGIQWWQFLTIVGGSMIIALGSCLVATWRWRVYHKRHQQDADLIKTLMDKESATLMGLRDLKKATENFADSAQIGEGGFGIVYTGTLNDGTRVAIKRSKREGSEKDKKEFLNEVRILSQVNHRHLVKLLGCCMENKIALLVFEYVANGTLQEHLHGKFGDGPRLSWKQRLDIAVQTAEAINYLHVGSTFPIYHRDVKSANILLTNNLNAKVADFGISKLAPLEATHVSTIAIQGTMGYIDPEYYTSYQLTDKSDVYSFGVVLLEVISAKPALDFQRGGDETSLVNLAKPCIEGEDLQQLIDPALLETYNNEMGRSSILHVGKIAMRCVDMRARVRPSMNEVLVDLKTLSLQLDETSEDLGSISNNDNAEDLRVQDGTIAIEMSEFSPTEFDILLNQGSNSGSSIASPFNSSVVDQIKSLVHSTSRGKKN